MLYSYAVKHGPPGSAKGWQEIVPGRTGSQSRYLEVRSLSVTGDPWSPCAGVKGKV